MRIEIPFVGPTYNGRSSKVNAQRTVNMFPKLEKPGSKTRIALYGTPGLKRIGVQGVGPCRSNGVKFKSKLYFVSGTDFVEIDSNNSFATLGALETNSSRCEMASGRNSIMVVDGISGYVFNGTSFSKILDLDFPDSPSHVTYLRSRFIVNKGSTDEFYISDDEDATSWGPLNFASAENNPDDILAHAATENDLYLIGGSTCQIFYNSGNPDFPFDPYPNGTVEVGIEAPHSLSQFSGGLVWLASNDEGDTFVVHAAGLTTTPISTSEIDWQISRIDFKADAIGAIYRQSGRTFYILTFPSADKTFCFDLTPDGRDWHERKSYGIGRWRVSGIGYLGNQVICGDYQNANFYNLDFNEYRDDGNIIERIRIAPVIHKSRKWMTFWELIVDIKAGTGLTFGQGLAPQIMLRYSDDGGKTWSSELWETIGEIGEYSREVKWEQLGDSKERIFEIKVTDPVEVEILGAYADITLGDF
ncbi:MAG: packaged DNA stabilization protein gp10 [Devosiaceae bacterium]|nr:packaged DNA stabilization protein gp10 [Devosiaceae bacterium]